MELWGQAVPPSVHAPQLRLGPKSSHHDGEKEEESSSHGRLLGGKIKSVFGGADVKYFLLKNEPSTHS